MCGRLCGYHTATIRYSFRDDNTSYRDCATLPEAVMPFLSATDHGTIPAATKRVCEVCVRAMVDAAFEAICNLRMN